MMRSCNKIDALMVDDIHECRGSGRYRNRQIKHIGVDFPLHFRLAIWGDVRGFGMGEISPDHRSDTEPLPAGFNGFKAADMRMHPFRHRSERVMVERGHAAGVQRTIGPHGIPTFPHGGAPP